ncbi:MAG TPA: TusE/DsrC/DsvC family sulfur relay protein [Burkholderiaceae bacterium]|nr:TusE/DsrC/DsvC family sulfur relay protein [Burkholderiaceae bacterium]HQR72489.1 TusE/DsrC/DsvC family sulfur relay protein [Burkholderiaceae bacterium]
MTESRPEFAAVISAPTDEEGYLVDPSDWDEAIAEALARREGIALTDEHWRVLRFMREFLDEHQLIPDARFVIRFLADEIGAGDAARQRLFELFPYGYVRQTCKIAGMRRPRAWSTG